MARLIGPDEGSREVKTIVGNVFEAKRGRPAQLWADLAATVPADVLTVDGAAIPDSTVTIDSSSMLPLIQYPPGDVDVVYVSVDGGPVWPIYARTDDRLDALGSAVVLLPAATGSDDTAAINAILAASAGKRVQGRAGAAYRTSAPLVVYSGTTLDMTSCTVTLLPGSDCNMLQNRAVATVRRVLDAVTTSGSATLTSATAAFTAADVGKPLTVQGAGAAGAPLTTTISDVFSGTTAALAATAGTTVTGQYAAIGTRDSDITIVGGTWDRGGNGSTPVQFSVDAHSLRFRHVDGLRVQGVTMLATGGKYSINPGDCTRIRVEGVNLPSYSSDGVHISGPCRQIVIKNIIGGAMGDDLVSFTARDTYVPVTDCAGDIIDVVVDTAMYRTAQTGGSLVSSVLKVVAGQNTDQTSDYVVRNLRARNLTGPTTTQHVVMVGDTYPVGGSGGRFEDIDIDGVHSLGGYARATVSLHQGAMDRVRIRRLTPHPDDLYGVSVDTDVDRLEVSGVHLDPTVAFGYLVSMAEGTVKRLLIQAVQARFSLSSHRLLRLTAGTTIQHAIFDDISVESTAGGDLISTQDATATLGAVHITNLHTTGIPYPLGTYRGTTEVSAVNVTATGMTRWLYATGGSAAVTVVGASGLSGDADGYQADSPSTVTVRTLTSLTTSPDLLATGEETLPRLMVQSAQTVTAGSLVLTYFTARKTETINNVKTFTEATAAAAATLCRIGVYSVAANGDLTLIASTANDITLWATTFGTFTRALQASWAKVAGRRYAVGVLAAGTTGPKLRAIAPVTGAESSQAPRINGTVAGQTDLPANVAAGSVTSAAGVSVYAAVTP